MEELVHLSREIREFILGSVSKTGGHLASNLGVVELTLALHYVFDFSRGKLLWDVGHQCYTHKIITARKENFARLRESEGVSGFPNPAESIYDEFAVGHAGTSIATAIGLALGQMQNKMDEKIVAVVGDASIVNGGNFEALNNLGLVKRQLLIVLNDNSMAIDITQGEVAKYFSRVRLSQTYEDLRRTTTKIIEHMPVIGKGVEDAIEKIKKSIRMTMPGSQMFESLNIPYFGPVDGHDTGSLVRLFRALSGLNQPALLHVYTRKGKGFKPAEEDRRRFHSTGPFKMNGDSLDSGGCGPKPAFTSVFGEHLVKLAGRDRRIVAITSAMCGGTGLTEFKEKFPERFYDVGIAESAAVDIASGLAREGLRPVVCIYSTFLQRSFDQIFQEVCLQNLPVVFCIDRAGLVGADGPTHHGLMDIGYLRMLPNMVLTAPANGTELRLGLEFALGLDRPVAMRYPKDCIHEYVEEQQGCRVPFEFGKSVVVRKNDNSPLTIVSYGAVLGEALKAEQQLSQEGIEVDVINARFAAPVDDKIIGLLKSGKGIITVEDHSRSCGFGSALLEKAAIEGSEAFWGRINVLGVPRKFITHSSRQCQLSWAGVNADTICETARRMFCSVR